MKKYLPLAVSLTIVVLAIYLNLPTVPWFFGMEISTHLGLDLRGGVQALLEADLPATTTVTAEQMDGAKQIVENRINGLGVSEAIIQRAGDRRIVVEIPGVDDPDKALATIRTTALLEFVDMGAITQQEALTLEGKKIRTDFGLTGVITGTDIVTPALRTWHTVLTGSDLKNAAAQSKTAGGYDVAIVFNSDAAQTFADYTGANVGKVLAIVLDKTVISVPTISNKIDGGSGVITGNYTLESANALALQLRSGSLPVPLKVVNSNVVGATLGEDSLNKSLIAGAIGLAMVVIFMGVYYRLPGIVADVALVCYALISMAIFRTVPVTLTLPGIAGFILSIGMAVDANVLIFERLKEELRNGRSLLVAIDMAWSKAWPSIRDSNISTILTCLVLYWFGSTFGASIVKGFSITLLLGVLTSLFTAIFVTRSFLHVVLDNVKASDKPGWFNA